MQFIDSFRILLDAIKTIHAFCLFKIFHPQNQKAAVGIGDDIFFVYFNLPTQNEKEPLFS